MAQLSPSLLFQFLNFKKTLIKKTGGKPVCLTLVSQGNLQIMQCTRKICKGVSDKETNYEFDQPQPLKMGVDAKKKLGADADEKALVR